MNILGYSSQNFLYEHFNIFKIVTLELIMVFGWGKKSQNQKEDIPSQKKQILLSDIQNVVDDMRSIRIKTIIAETKAFRNKIKSSCEIILHIAIDLERDTLKVDDMDIHIKGLVVRGKKEVISVIKRETIVKLPEINSYNDVKIFNAISSRMLKKIGDALGRQSIAINAFAKKYATKLKNDLRIMTDGSDEITTIITNQTELEIKINSILDTIDKIQQSKKLVIDLAEQQKHTEKMIDDLIVTIKQDEKEVIDIKRSNEYEEYLQINEKLNSLSSEKNKIKDEIELQFTKISRPLNKYVYISSLDKPQKKLLANLIANPYDVLVASNKQDVIKILESTRNAVQSGSVSVKDTDKSLSQIDETLSLLATFIQKIEVFNRSKDDIESKLSVLNNEHLNQKESALNIHQNDKSTLESKIKSLENELNDVVEHIPKYIKSIESTLNQISAVQYSIRTE